jgi:hypothetical protein
LISTTIVNCKRPETDRHAEKQRSGADLEEYRTVIQKDTKDFRNNLNIPWFGEIRSLRVEEF